MMRTDGSRHGSCFAAAAMCLAAALGSAPAAAADGHLYVIAGSTFNAAPEDWAPVGSSDVLSIWIGDLDITDGSFGNWRRASSVVGDLGDIDNATDHSYIENSCFIHGGRLYVVSGTTLSRPDASVWTSDYVAWFDIQPDGDLGPFQRSAAFPQPPAGQRLVPAAFATIPGGRAFLYLFGGNSDLGQTDRALAAELLADGSLGAWQTVTALPAAEWFHRVARVGAHIYMMGGNLTDGPHSWSIAVQPDGTLGSWQQQADFPAGDKRWDMAIAVANDRIYIAGGNGQSDQVFMAEPQDGTIAEWRALAPLPRGGRRWPAVSDGTRYLWVLGGRSPGSGENSDVIQRGVIEPADGTVVWDADLRLPQDRSFHGAALLLLNPWQPPTDLAITATGREGAAFWIEFPSSAGAVYRIEGRASLAAADWAPVTFGLTAAGPFDQTTAAGTGNTVRVYVAAGTPSGFYRAVRQ